MTARGFRVDAVLFDFDGTLTEPGALSFATIRAAIDCPPGRPILEFLAALPDPADRERRMGILESFELEAAAASRPSRGAEAAVLAVKERGLPVALISRNGLRSIERALDNFSRLTTEDFDLILAREAQPRPKPAPDGVLLAARRLHVDPSRMLVVGDYVFDLEAGRAAGALTVLVRNGDEADHGWDYDFAIDTLVELPALVDLGRPLACGQAAQRAAGDVPRHAATGPQRAARARQSAWTWQPSPSRPAARWYSRPTRSPWPAARPPTTPCASTPTTWQPWERPPDGSSPRCCSPWAPRRPRRSRCSTRCARPRSPPASRCAADTPR